MRYHVRCHDLVLDYMHAQYDPVELRQLHFDFASYLITLDFEYTSSKAPPLGKEMDWVSAATRCTAEIQESLACFSLTSTRANAFLGTSINRS